MNTNHSNLLQLTRRHFFHDCALGVGKIALASLLTRPFAVGAQTPPQPSANPLAPRPPHHAARAKRVIYLFMAGGPSQLEMFDHKPVLNRLDGQADSRFLYSRAALRLHGHLHEQGTAQVVALGGGSPGTAKAAPMSPSCCRTSRSIADDIAIVRGGADGSLQSRPGEDCSSTPGRPSSAGLAWGRG